MMIIDKTQATKGDKKFEVFSYHVTGDTNERNKTGIVIKSGPQYFNSSDDCKLMYIHRDCLADLQDAIDTFMTKGDI